MYINTLKGGPGNVHYLKLDWKEIKNRGSVLERETRFASETRRIIWRFQKHILKNRQDRYSNPFHIKTAFNLLPSEMYLLKSLRFCKAETGVFYRRKASSKFGGWWGNSEKLLLSILPFLWKSLPRQGDWKSSNSTPPATITLFAGNWKLECIVWVSLA